MSSMKDKDKSREQLIHELSEYREKCRKLETPCLNYKESTDSMESFKKALETMQLGVTISDLNGMILYTNPAELAMHGYTEEEIQNNTVRMFAPSTMWKPLRPEQIASMKRWDRESINAHKDGKLFPVRLMSDVIKNAKDEPVGIVTTCESITTQKELEEDINNKIKELEDFYEMAINREIRMKELKKEILKLKAGHAIIRGGANAK